MLGAGEFVIVGAIAACAGIAVANCDVASAAVDTSGVAIGAAIGVATGAAIGAAIGAATDGEPDRFTESALKTGVEVIAGDDGAGAALNNASM